jgi:hypothetical protein
MIGCPYRDDSTVAHRCRAGIGGLRGDSAQTLRYRFPQKASCFGFERIAPTLLGIAVKIWWARNPILFWEEERFFQQNAPNLWIIVPSDLDLAIVCDPIPQLIHGMYAVVLAECIPRQRDRKHDESREESAAGDKVSWGMEFEKKEFAWIERFKGWERRWPPEVHFFDG